MKDVRVEFRVRDGRARFVLDMPTARFFAIVSAMFTALGWLIWLAQRLLG